MIRLMTRTMRRADDPIEEVELLAGEVFEAPAWLSLAEARHHTGGTPDGCPFDDRDPEDDR